MWPQFRKQYREIAVGACLAAASIALHLVPFFRFGANPLGYDTGFYRRYLTQPFVSFPNAPVPGLGTDALVPRLLLDAMRLTHLPPDLILYGTYILFFAAMPVLLFFLLRPRLGIQGAAIAGALLAASAVSYNGYWFILYKNALALDLFLAAFIAFESNATLILIGLDVALALTHKTTAIIYLLTLGVLFLYEKGRRKEVLVHMLATAMPFALANLSLAHTVALSEPSAIFLDWQTYLDLSLPLLLLIAVGWRGVKLGLLPHIWPAFAVVALAFPILHLPFYERIFLFSDLALIPLAACAAPYLLRKTYPLAQDWFAYVALGALFIVTGYTLGNLWNQAHALEPLMPDAGVAQIETVGALVPANATLLTTADEAPWYEGWTRSHIAAPGLLHDDHDLEAWTAFWNSTSTPDRIAFLDSFDKPLYISTLGSWDDLIGSPPPCLTSIAPYLLRDDCRL